MKNEKFKKIITIILLNISLSTVALPPDMQADRYLVQVEKILKNKVVLHPHLCEKYKFIGSPVCKKKVDYNRAKVPMDKIMALKDQHNLELPIAFYFKYAKIMLRSDDEQRGNKSFTAINHYLTVAGKSGANYAEALELYDTSLFERLAKAKTTNEIKQLIELGADVNSRLMPLDEAVKISNLEGVKSLIKAGADVNSNTLSPLHTAALLSKDTTIIKVLIEAGADVNPKFDNNRFDTIPAYLEQNSGLSKR